jgi:Fe-S oxidoreductase
MIDFRELRRSTHADQCVECGKCTSMCPLGTRADFSARRIATEDLSYELEGKGVGIGRCLTCASCEQRCPQDVHFVEFVRGLRAFVPQEHRRPCPHGAILRHAAAVGNGSDPSFRSLDWLDEDLRISEEGPIGLFVGCAPLLDVVFSGTLGVDATASARSAIRILNRVGIEPVVAPTEACCGHDQFWAGDRDTYERLGRRNMETFRGRGVEHVLTACAECARTWSLDYPKLDPGYSPRVQHMSQWMAEHLDDLDFAGGETVDRLTYHDPCRLGRQMGEYDAPRAVMQAMPDLDLTEMPRHGRNALCCGTSGFQHCDAESRRLQSERLLSARRTGASTMVTACPKCLVHFACAQHEDSRRIDHPPELGLIDLTVLAASRLTGPRGAVGEVSDQAEEGIHE